jgi:hypothetical protein
MIIPLIRQPHSLNPVALHRQGETRMVICYPVIIQLPFNRVEMFNKEAPETAANHDHLLDIKHVATYNEPNSYSNLRQCKST